MKNQDIIELYELVVAHLEGDMTADQFQSLNQKLQDQEQARCYAEFVSIFSSLSCPDKSDRILDREIDDIADDRDEYTRTLMMLAEQEQHAPAIEVPREIRPEETVEQTIYPAREKRQMSKFTLASLIISAAAILFLVVMVKVSPVPQTVEVANLTEMVDVKWADPSFDFVRGDRLYTNETFALSKGFIEIETDRGVTLTIEGPAEFEMMPDADMHLRYGRVYANVSEQGIGFTVTTDNSRIIDLGTQFGVRADIDGQTQLHVFKGKTTLVSGGSWLAKQSQTVLQQQARQISNNGTEVKEVPLQKDGFVRSIDSASKSVWRGQTRLCLADIVGGGSGLGNGTIGSYIETATGQWHPNSNILGDGARVAERKTSNGFQPVTDNPFIDGVFIPDPDRYEPVIDSQGTRFDQMPSTFGSGFGGVLYIPAEKIGGKLIGMDGLLYGTRENPAILLHASGGVTFDLKQIRQAYPGASLKAFTSDYGLSDSVRKADLMGYADFWVLIDGQVRFSKTGVTGHGGRINIPITENDHFLTLITTDGGKGTRAISGRTGMGDLCVFGHPFLVIE